MNTMANFYAIHLASPINQSQEAFRAWGERDRRHEEFMDIYHFADFWFRVLHDPARYDFIVSEFVRHYEGGHQRSKFSMAMYVIFGPRERTADAEYFTL